jgi:phosphate-selective porin OprO/OprP
MAIAIAIGTSPALAETSNETPVVEQLLDIMRSKGDINDEQHDELLGKARDEREALLATKPAPKAEASGPRISTRYDGLRVESQDGKFKFRVGGRIQADANVFDQDKTQLGDGMELRRARIKAQGTLYNDFAYKLEVNFDPDGKVAITDGWISYKGFKPLGLPLVLTAGHQKVPFSQQSMTSSNWQVFQERSMQDSFIDNPATGRRRLGLVGRSYGDNWLLSLGFFGEGVDYPGRQDENFGTAGRLLFYPLIEDRKFVALGGAVYYRDWRRNAIPGTDVGDLEFAARPEAHIAGSKLIDTGELFNVDNLLMYNLQATGVFGSFHAQAEYTGSRVNRKGDTDPDLNFGGWYIQAGYFLTGEQRNYDRRSGKYRRIAPKSVVGDGGFGAWEIAARYSEMDLMSKNVKGGKERNVTLGLNWWLNRSLMLRLNYVYANPHPGSAQLPENRGRGVNQRINILEGRAQVVF